MYANIKYASYIVLQCEVNKKFKQMHGNSLMLEWEANKIIKPEEVNRQRSFLMLVIW